MIRSKCSCSLTGHKFAPPKGFKPVCVYIDKYEMAALVRSLTEVVRELGPSMSQKHHTQTHIAFIIKRGKIIAYASNVIGSRHKGSGYNSRSLHAEVAVIKKVGDVRILDGADLFVFRWTPPGSSNQCPVSNSCPCHSCSKFLTKCMKKYGLNKVYYSS